MDDVNTTAAIPSGFNAEQWSRVEANTMAHDEFSDLIFADFDRSGPVISDADLEGIESLETSNRRIRRAALLVLTMPGVKIIESVTADREGALAFAEAAECAKDYGNLLRSLADLMDNASMRIKLALCQREDMGEVMAEVSHG